MLKTAEQTLLSQQNNFNSNNAPKVFKSFGAFLCSLGILLCSCASPLDIFATRPKLEMSMAKVALIAARKSSAETKSPAYYRRARDHYITARQAYRRKDFGSAKRHANASIKYSEQAEFESLRISQEND